MILRLFATFVPFLVLAIPAGASTVCAPKTVSVADKEYCEARVSCARGEYPVGGSCSFTRASVYANRAQFAYGHKTGWYCEGGNDRYNYDCVVSASITCCKDIADLPPPPAEAKAPASNVQPATQQDTRQTQAAANAARVSLLGAGQAGTVAALDCAAGANEAVEKKDDDGTLFQSCYSGLGAAKGLETLAAKGGEAGKAAADEELLASKRGKTTLAAFEKNFGMDGRDFVKKLMAAGPSKDVLTGLLGHKIPADKVPDPASPPSVPQAPAEPVVAERPKEKAEPVAASPAAGEPSKGRKNRRISMSDYEVPQALNDSYMSMGETLTPLQGDPLLENSRVPPTQAEPEQEWDELTLFDIVHRKYQQKALMLAPRKKK